MIRVPGRVFSRAQYKLAYVLALIVVVSCNGGHGKSFLPDIPNYDNKGRQIFILHKKLLEISGITYNDDRTLSAVNDEDGKIFRIDFSKGKPASVDFGGEGDYEDIVLAGGNYYVMESKGDISVVPIANPGSTRKISFKKKSKVEFESLYLDKRSGKLVLLSKEQRKVEDAILAYSFDPVDERFSTEPIYSIPLKDVKRLMKDYSAECKPSAAAVHPVLNKLFIVASVGKVLLVCTLDGQVEKVYFLNPDLFSQPEGICFSPQGDMFISNEGLQGKATIVMYRYQPLVTAYR